MIAWRQPLDTCRPSANPRRGEQTRDVIRQLPKLAQRRHGMPKSRPPHGKDSVFGKCRVAHMGGVLLQGVVEVAVEELGNQVLADGTGGFQAICSIERVDVVSRLVDQGFIDRRLGARAGYGAFSRVNAKIGARRDILLRCHRVVHADCDDNNKCPVDCRNLGNKMCVHANLPGRAA